METYFRVGILEENKILCLEVAYELAKEQKLSCTQAVEYANGGQWTKKRIKLLCYSREKKAGRNCLWVLAPTFACVHWREKQIHLSHARQQAQANVAIDQRIIGLTQPQDAKYNAILNECEAKTMAFVSRCRIYSSVLLKWNYLSHILHGNFIFICTFTWWKWQNNYFHFNFQ